MARNGILVLTAGLLAGVSAFAAQPANAQAGATETAAAGSEFQAGEIVVTAQKREQRLSDVGLTVSAATGEQLTSAGVAEVSELGKLTPGLNVGTSFVGNFKIFSIRGVSLNAAQFSAPPAVSVYVDEAILPYSSMTGGLLLDVERVEVVKGPQGTLFGQNATGGSVNVIAAKPTSTPSAGFDVEVNHFGQVQLSGFASGPLSDSFRVRLAASTTQFGAWQRGYFLHRLKNGDQNKGAARLITQWDAAERLKITASLSGNYDHGEIQQWQFVNAQCVRPATCVPEIPTYQLPNDARDAEIVPGRNPKSDSWTYQAVLRADWEIGDRATVTSLTNYVDTRFRNTRDPMGVGVPVVRRFTRAAGDSISQELRISGTAFANDLLTYIAGATYQKDSLEDGGTTFQERFSGFPYGSITGLDYEVRNRSAGVFGNVDIKVAPGLTLTGGGRYSETRQALKGCSTADNDLAASAFTGLANARRAAVGLPPTDAFVAGGCATLNNIPATPGGTPTFLPAFADFVQKEHNLSWRVGVNYKPSDNLLLYTLASRGYKAGLFPVNFAVFAEAVQPVQQEKLTSYEAGFKFSTPDRTIQINGSGFYYNYVDKQFYTYIPSPVGTIAIIVNIPKSKVYGFEAELTVRPVDNLRLHGAVTYTHTEVGTYLGLNSQGLPTDYTGSRFNYAPDWSATFDAEYRSPISGDLTGVIAVNGVYNSHTFSDLGEVRLDRVPSYYTLDARIGVESVHGWQASLFARNFTNEYYWTAVLPGQDTRTKFAGMPRTFGAALSFRF